MGGAIDTGRLHLRRFEASDAELLRELDSDPEVMRYLSGGAPTPAEHICDTVLPAFMRHNADDNALGGWAVYPKADGAFLGWVSLRAEPEAAAELGYRFRRAAWGHGFATEAATAVLDRAFAGPELERVFATTYEENRASRAVMERLGMRFVRSFRFTPGKGPLTHVSGGDEPWPGDDVEFEITRSEWLARAAKR